MQIQYTAANSDDDLKGILSLQAENLPKTLSDDEIKSQGFVTLEHSFELIKEMNETEQHIIAKSDNNVIGYTLSMTKKAKLVFPILYPMFDVFDKTVYNGKTISEYNYIIVGQVCVSKKFRGLGVFDHCYEAYRNFHKDKYDFAITEIAQSNLRSINAHKRIGFSELTRYTDSNNNTWIVVIWDWTNSR